MMIKRVFVSLVFMCFASVLWASSLFAGGSADLEKKLDELTRLNKALTERLEQVEKELKTLKAHEGEAVPYKAEGVEEAKWYDRIDVGLSVAGVAMDVSGVDKDIIDATNGAADANKSYGSVQVDMEVSAEFAKNSRGFILLEMGSGKSPMEDLGEEFYPFAGIADEAVMGPEDDLGEGDVRISEAWYEHDFVAPGGNLRFRVGKVDITTDFDTNEVANDENSQFMSEMFVNNIAVDWPDYAFGAMLWYESDLVSVGMGYADHDGEWEELFDTPFAIFEVDVTPSIAGLKGNYRVYAWYNDDPQESYNNGVSDGYGIGLSIDQEVANGVGVFLRYGWMTGDEDVYPINYSVSGGVALKGSLWNRAGDCLAIGVGMSGLAGSYEDELEDNGYDSDSEYHVEAYYSYQVNNHFSVTPSIQWTQNPAGFDDMDDMWIFAVRGFWEF